MEGLAGEADAVLNEEALGNTCSFEIAGLTDESYFTGPMLGCPPVVIVSEQAVREFTDRYYVSKAAVQYKKSYDEKTESAVLSLVDESPDAKDFSYTSRIREAETVKSAQGNMMEVGIGVAAVLAFIGILFVVIRALAFGDPTSGWPSMVCIILLCSGVQLFCTGIVGEYLAKTYLEVKHRPIYIVAETEEGR